MFPVRAVIALGCVLALVAARPSLGRTFASPVRVNDIAGEARISGWLDHRGLAAAKPGGEHKGEHDGVAMAQRSGLYYTGAGFGTMRVLGDGSYPVAAAASTGLVVAWTEGQPANASVRVRVIESEGER